MLQTYFDAWSPTEQTDRKKATNMQTPPPPPKKPKILALFKSFSFFENGFHSLKEH